MSSQQAAFAEVDSEPFVQSDWEFALDTMPNPTRMDLEAHLAAAPVNNETAAFLKGYLMQLGGFTFTPIE